MRYGTALLFATPFGSAAGQQFIVIANAASPIATLSKEQLSAIFQKKLTKWNDTISIVPIDHEKGAKLRDTFCRAVLGRSASVVDNYWQTQIYSGRDVPPQMQRGDARVLEYMKTHPNAIGYVAAGTALGKEVKVITVKGL